MSQDRPLVSIGMPVYNGQKYIVDAIESILAQSFSEFELIISDNASTDRTQEICLAYASQDPRVRYHRNRENIGGRRNFNQVFGFASGKYFKWAAHDDYCEPGFFERCVVVLENDPSVVLCYPRTLLINDEGTIFGEYADGLHLLSSHPHERFAQLFDRQGLCHAVYGLARTDALSQTGLERNVARADRVLLAELSLYGKMWEVDDYLFRRRIHAGISTATLTSDQQLALWYDPDKNNKIVLPKWRRFWEYLLVVRSAPISPLEKALCYYKLVQNVASVERWRGILGDLTYAVSHVAKRRNLHL